MTNTVLQNKLLRLGYSQRCLDTGVLTNEMLEEQIRELNRGEDDNTEHYRYRTLTNYFNESLSYDDIILNDILQLLQNDGDKLMASSAMVELLEKRCLTNKQFNMVANSLRTFGDWTVKRIERAQLKRSKQNE